MKILGAVVAVCLFVLAACGGGLESESGVPYGSITELEDAFTSAGFPCTNRERDKGNPNDEDFPTFWAEGSVCRDPENLDTYYRLNIYDTQKDLQIDLDIALDMADAGKVLVGPNWIIFLPGNYPEAVLSGMQEKLGGKVAGVKGGDGGSSGDGLPSAADWVRSPSSEQLVNTVCSARPENRSYALSGDVRSDLRARYEGSESEIGQLAEEIIIYISDEIC